MTIESRRRRPRTGLTLERAILLALLLHVLGGMAVSWWPGLLYSAQSPAEQSRPLEFRFVDTPDREEPEEVPDNAELSDRDRRAADSSPRDDRDTPFSEGNTEERVLRSPELPVPQQTPSPIQPAPQPSPPAETLPEPAESRAEPAPETVTEEAEGPAEESPEEVPEEVPEADSRATLPPPRPGIRGSMARLESFVQPEAFDNQEGGVGPSDSLADFDTRGYDLGAYLRRVLVTIERNWKSNMPPLLRTGTKGAAFVAISIERGEGPDGEETATILAQRTWSSGQPAYDQTAHFALELSNPLPPIPDHYPYDSIEGRIGFLYNLRPSEVSFPERQVP